MHSINLADKLTQFSDHWSPKILTDFNNHDVMVVRVHLLLIEPKGTPNTGDADTAAQKQRL